MKAKPSYNELAQENAQLRGKVSALEAELSEVKALLKGLLGQDSRNSHRPPSQDKKRYPKTKLRIKQPKAKEKPAAQTLAYKEVPDYVETLLLERLACDCGRSLAQVACHWERVQVYDMPELRMEVTEYRRERKRCCCGCLYEAELPEGVQRGVQYGARVKGLLSYLHQYQQLPLARCAELISDCFGQAISEKSILRSEANLYHLLEQAEHQIVEGLRRAQTLHSDETGIFVEQKNHWLHVRSNDKLTYYHVDKSRGLKAHQAIGLLGECSGVMMHDCYLSYFKHQGVHALCHSHTMRELLAVWEDSGQQWAYDLAHHLLHAQHERQANVNGLKPAQQADFMKGYQALVLQGLVENPVQLRASDAKKRGKVKQAKAHNLVMRLLDHATAATLFIRDPTVPFTNNQAERDLRMVKLKQKISGGFRTRQGAHIYARIRGYISTLRKQACHVLETLTQVFQHNVFIPSV